MSLVKNAIQFLLFAAIVLQSAQSFAQEKDASKQQAWPGKKTVWKGFARYDFEVDGRSAYVVQPKHIAPGKPWVWRARFPNFHAEADLILLERGFHIARINTDGMLGSPNAMKHWDTFYEFVTDNGLAKQCALEGVSRGGLFVYGFASRWPDRVACIYCDTPVCDGSSWPGGKGEGRGHDPTWQRFLQEYELTEETVKTFFANPIDRLEPIAKAEIPIMHIVSLNDEIVPPQENTFVLAERIKKLGREIEIIEVQTGTEKSGGHHFTHPDPIRVADFIELHGSALPKLDDYFELRGSLKNCRHKFETELEGRVVFLGGSITTMKGWRNLTAEYLQAKFPKTKFDFVDAGISSTGSVPAAFRLKRDVFGRGPVDLLFEEAAVNDLHNMRTPTESVQGMEGIIRHAKKINPKIDIVVMEFVDPKHISDYRKQKTPSVIVQHEQVAKHYDVTSINLALETTERIDAGQFDWKNDFKNCHPSPFGHRVYASTIRRTLNAAWAPNTNAETKTTLPEPILANSFDGGNLFAPGSATNLNGFSIIPNCDPRLDDVGGNVRAGFNDVPMLVGLKVGDSFDFEFEGRAVGIFVAAGPDAGTIEYSIDGAPIKRQDLFTKWSQGLHIPWAYVLDSELSNGKHRIQIRIADQKNTKSTGNACRIVSLLVNE